MDQDGLIRKYLEGLDPLSMTSVESYAKTGKVSGSLLLALRCMLDEHAKCNVYEMNIDVQALRNTASDAEFRRKLQEYL